MTTIALNKAGYEPFIDFLKGFAIISVILTHCLPNLNEIGFIFWGGQAVPIFLIIQSWHVFKKDSLGGFDKSFYQKVFEKIVLPFAVVEGVMLVSEVIVGLRWDCLYDKIKVFVRSGGEGPGAYYFWMYLQFAVILPVFKRVSLYVRGWRFGVLLLFISIVVEVLCNLFDCPLYLYRLAAFRYLFLMWFGYDWARNGIKIGLLEIVLSLVSIVFIWLFTYEHFTLNPWFFDYWQQYHWICYFYPAYLLVWILHWLHTNIGFRVRTIIMNVGESSYWIYISQLLVFYFWWLFFSQINATVRCLVTIMLSIGLGMSINMMNQMFKTKRRAL